MTAPASWAQKFLAPFKEPKMDNDPLESGAGAGEPVHADQDNAPTPAAAIPSTGSAGDQVRMAVATMYPGNPHKQQWGRELGAQADDAESRGWSLAEFIREELEEVGDAPTDYGQFIRNLATVLTRS